MDEKMKNVQVALVLCIYIIFFSLDATADSNTASTLKLNNISDINQSKTINDDNIFAQKIVKFFQGIIDDAYDFAEINGMKKSEK